MVNWKRTLRLTLAVLALSGMFGCTGARPSDEPNLDPAAMVQAMMEADSTLPEMVVRASGDDGAEDSFFFLSDLDYGKVEAYFYACADAGTAQEIAVVKLKDKSDAAAMMDSLHDHLEARRGVFQEYDPAQVPLTEDAVVTREGRYVTLIVSEKSGLVQKTFQEFFAEG